MNANKDPDLKVFIVNDHRDLKKILQIRLNVFVQEQGCPIEVEIDEYDSLLLREDGVVHFLAKLNDYDIGGARVIFPDKNNEFQKPHVQRVCVLKNYRGKNYGLQIMEEIHKYLKDNNIYEAELSSQTYAIGFYEKLGYVTKGRIYMEAGIEHCEMETQLQINTTKAKQ